MEETLGHAGFKQSLKKAFLYHIDKMQWICQTHSKAKVTYLNQGRRHCGDRTGASQNPLHPTLTIFWSSFLFLHEIDKHKIFTSE